MVMGMNKENRPVKVSIADVKEALERGNLVWIRCEVQEALDTWQSGLEQADQAVHEDRTELAVLRCRLWARIAEVWLARGLLSEAAQAIGQFAHQAELCAQAQPELRALAHVWQSRIAGRRHNLDEAQERIDEAMRMAETLPLNEAKQQTLAQVYLERGLVAFERSDNQSAMRSVFQARSFYQHLEDRHGEASCVVALGRIYSRTSFLKKAISYFEEANTIFQSIPRDPVLQYLLQLGWGSALGIAERYMEASVHYRSALNLARQLGSDPYVASCLNNIATILQGQGQQDQALKLHEEALGLFRALRNRYGMAVIMNNMGEIYLDLGNASKALALLEEARHLAETIDCRYVLPDIYCLLSAAHLLLKQPSVAFEHAEKALEVARELTNPSNEGAALRALGMAAAALEKQDRLPAGVPPGGPESYFVTSMELLRREDRVYEQARTLQAWGTYLKASDDPLKQAKGESYLQQAADQFKQLGLALAPLTRLGQAP